MTVTAQLDQFYYFTGNIDMQAFDLIVIGSGTVGYEVASTCRSSGWTAKTLLADANGLLL